ncbi:MAG: hypothetical protein NTY80_04680 [candidate division SR1 bacterium]|nr:hypothetical protein [candidate division SR1 bacterium]
MKEKVKITIKFLVVVMVFYAFLIYNIFNIGEKLVPIEKDYVNIDIAETNQAAKPDTNAPQGTGHFVAYDSGNLVDLCNSIGICEKINFKGTFTDTEKYTYISIFDRVIQFIHNNSTGSKQIEDVIHDIEINKENGDRRGYATRDSIIFNIGSVQSKKEFTDLSSHEMGHVTDLGYVQGISPKKDKNYTEFGKVVFSIDDISLGFYKLSRNKETVRKPEAKKKDFCSGYGMSDPFEDFAECFNLYINHNSFFKQSAKINPILRKKYNIIASIFSGKYIGANTQDLVYIKTNTSRRPRDTTKIN